MIRHMKQINKICRKASGAGLTGVWILLIIYFANHAFSGEYSLARYNQLRAEESRLVPVANTVAAEKSRIEARIALMGPSVTDPDMLEEQVRRQLGFAHADEVVMFLDDVHLD